MGAHEHPQLGRQREHDVEVGNGQEEVVLPGEPALGGVLAASGTGPVAAGVEVLVLGAALDALRDMAAELGSTAVANGL